MTKKVFSLSNIIENQMQLVSNGRGINLLADMYDKAFRTYFTSNTKFIPIEDFTIEVFYVLISREFRIKIIDKTNNLCVLNYVKENKIPFIKEEIE